MKRPFLASVVGLITAAGLVCGQTPPAPSSPDPTVPPPLIATPTQPVCGVAPETEPTSTFFTAQVDYLLWVVKDEQFRSGLATTDALLRGQVFSDTVERDRSGEAISGGRFTFGYWLEDYDPVLSSRTRLALAGAEASVFFLGERSASMRSGTAPTLLRPFFDLNNGVITAAVVALPGLARGELSGQGQFQLWGAEANGWCNVCGNPPGQLFRVDLMAGFRHLNLDGSLQITQNTRFGQNLTAFPTFVPLAGDRLQVSDSFSVDNQYYGGQVGLRIKMLLEYCDFTTTLKYGVGTTHQRLTIEGGQVLTAADGTQTRAVGGLLALPSNIGTHTRNRFSQVPEANFNLGVRLGKSVTLNLGYNVFYFSRVIRAGNQIDRVIDIASIPNFPGAAAAVPTGLGRPAALFRESGLLAQGLNLGLQLTW